MTRNNLVPVGTRAIKAQLHVIQKMALPEEISDLFYTQQLLVKYTQEIYETINSVTEQFDKYKDEQKYIPIAHDP